MLAKLIKHRLAIESVLADRAIVTANSAQNLEISQQEWNVISELCEVLEPLELATNILCSDTVFPVSMVRPVMKALVKKLEPQTSGGHVVENFKEMVRLEISRRFSLDWDGQLTSVSARQRASFLDPRYKSLHYEVPGAREATFEKCLMTWHIRMTKVGQTLPRPQQQHGTYCSMHSLALVACQLSLKRTSQSLS